MKNALILLAFGVLAFAIFTGIGTAEEKGGEKIVWKSYDISQLYVYDYYQRSPIQCYDSYEFDYEENECIYAKDVYWVVREHIAETLATQGEDEKDYHIWQSFNGTLWVECPSRLLVAFDRSIAQLLTRELYYDVRLALFRKDTAKQPRGEMQKPDDFEAAVSALLRNGYEAVSDIETSLITDRWAYISELTQDSYIRDYEGLIASAASILDPVVNTLYSGLDVRLRIVEKKNSLELEMELFCGILNGFDRTITNGYPVEKQRFAYKEFERFLRFSVEGKPLGRTEFRSAGYDNVLLVSVMKQRRGK